MKSRPFFKSLITLFAVALLAACVAPPIKQIEKQPSFSLEQPESTELGQLFSPVVTSHPGESGFLLLDKGEDALLWRGALTDAAIKTLDAQYYIWHDDNVGTIAAERLLKAAKRGVRVRVLLDDFSLNTEPQYLVHLDAHPNIEIRVYNPLGAKYGSQVIRAFAILRDFRRLNRRMHNKVFIADGSIAIVGGRNIGDEYYDMHAEFNFRDRDILSAGPVVNDASRSFDAYWNSVWSIPIQNMIHLESEPDQRKQYYRELHEYAAHPENFPFRFYEALDEMQKKLYQLPDHLLWGKAILVYDIPGKNKDPDRVDAFGESGKILTEVALQTEQEIIAETPYLYLMQGTFEAIDQLHQRGVRIRVLTNSLASTDMIAIFAPYSKQRPEIVRRGVELYEMMHSPKIQETIIDRFPLIEQDPYLSLHAKTAVFDRKAVFIGSFNLDPRSTHLNTEVGLLIYSEPLAEQVVSIMEEDFKPENSYQLNLTENDKIRWNAIKDDQTIVLEKEPDTTFSQRLKLFFYSLLPLTQYF